MRGRKARWHQLNPTLGGFVAYWVAKGGARGGPAVGAKPGTYSPMGAPSTSTYSSQLGYNPAYNQQPSTSPYTPKGAGQPQTAVQPPVQPFVARNGTPQARSLTAPPPQAIAGGGQANVQSIISQLQGLQDKSNAANEGRYQQLLGLADSDRADRLGALSGLYNEMYGLSGAQSDAAFERERRQTDGEMGRMQQSVVSRGLGNTTITDSLRRGIVDDSALRQKEIQDGRAQQMLGLKGNYASQLLDTLGRVNENKMGVIERRSDEGPNLGMYAQLLQAAGSMGGTGSTGGGSTGGTGGGGTGANAYAGFGGGPIVTSFNMSNATNGIPLSPWSVKTTLPFLNAYRTPQAANAASNYTGTLTGALNQARSGVANQPRGLDLHQYVPPSRKATYTMSTPPASKGRPLDNDYGYGRA